MEGVAITKKWNDKALLNDAVFHNFDPLWYQGTAIKSLLSQADVFTDQI